MEFSAGRGFPYVYPSPNRDGEALCLLLNDAKKLPRIFRALPLTVAAQALDELRRVAMRFETREAAFWLVENNAGWESAGRIGIQNIELVARRSARLQGIPFPVSVTYKELQKLCRRYELPPLTTGFAPRIEMRLEPGQEFTAAAALQAPGLGLA